MIGNSGYAFGVITSTLVMGISTTEAQVFLLSMFKEEDKAKDLFDFDGELNTTVPIESSTKEPLADISKSTMDIITVVWYISTFLALAAFFLLMACSDRRCSRESTTSSDQPIPPPTPAPSYSEFAPPSYETVVKQYPQIFVLPVAVDLNTQEKCNSSGAGEVKLYTVNELQKCNS